MMRRRRRRRRRRRTSPLEIRARTTASVRQGLGLGLPPRELQAGHGRPPGSPAQSPCPGGGGA
eukprot:4311483-Pyramimonas_sp.AAC.1